MVRGIAQGAAAWHPAVNPENTGFTGGHYIQCLLDLLPPKARAGSGRPPELMSSDAFGRPPSIAGSDRYKPVRRSNVPPTKLISSDAFDRPLSIAGCDWCKPVRRSSVPPGNLFLSIEERRASCRWRLDRL
jgi:hypothetical protein